jgi:2-methylcitrate dehydratase
MDDTTARLAAYATQAEYTGLSPETVHASKRTLIDSFACAIGAYDEPVCRMAREFAKSYSAPNGAPAAGIWGCSTITTPEAAAFANGVMVRFLDINDMYRKKSGGHPSDIASGLIAVAEAVHADGRALINALALAYDVYCGACDAIDVNSLGWDTPFFGAVACALGAGKLLGLTREQLGEAAALALVPNMTLFQTRTGDLSSWKGCAGANGARNGVFAALLARQGFTGPTAAFEGSGGLWDVVGRFDLALPTGPGATRYITRTNMKCFPVCYHGQAAVRTALQIRPRVRVEDIAEIEIGAYKMAVEQMATDPSRWAPKTRETADHSLPYVVAAALLDGKLTTHSYSAERLVDPRIAGLIRKSRAVEVPDFSARYPEYAQCRIKIRTVSGNTVVAEVDNPKGHATSPMEDSDLEAKFRAFFEGYGSNLQCETLLKALWDLDKVREIGDVLKLISSDR